MPSVCFYFQVHQPFRLRKYHVFEVGTHAPYFDDELNKQICKKVAQKCYIPANKLFLELVKKYPDFKIAYSISGIALEQFARYTPEVLESFKALADTGQVEFLAETYYHSLAALANRDEFRRQVKRQNELVEQYLGVKPQVFRNTELIFTNTIAWEAQQMGFKGIITEGATQLMHGRSPAFIHSAVGSGLPVLTKYFQLSDDIAFRFSNREWPAWPLTAETFAHWVHAEEGDTINLFMDYETFGEHQWESTGIFEFLRELPEAICKNPAWDFATPSEVIDRYPVRGEVSADVPISWADQERDLSAWLGNPLQDSTFAWVYKLGEAVERSKDPELLDIWGRFQTSDHFYYQCTKFWQDGDVHKYFSAYESPHQAYMFMSNALSDFEILLKERGYLKKLSPPAPLAEITQPVAAKRGIAIAETAPKRSTPRLPKKVTK